MATDIKRMRYFDGLFMKQDEFNLDQDYHRRIRRLHNTHLHGNGIAYGLRLEAGPGSQQVTVKPGMGIDKHFDTTYGEETGREIIVVQDQLIDMSIYNPLDEVYVWVSYLEQQADVVPDRGGSEPIHWLESATVSHGLTKPGDLEANLLLGKVIIKNDHTVDSGSIVEDENNVPLRKEISSGTTVVEGSGDSVGKNYVTNSNAEVDVQNWSDSTSGNLDVSQTTAAGEVLAGSASFLITGTTSVAAESDYVTIAVDPIDEEDKIQLFACEFSYKAHGGYESDHLKVIVRDTTNNVDLVPFPTFIPGGQGKYRGVVTTSTSATYEIRLVSTVGSTPFSISVDSVRFGPNNTVVGPAIGGWIEYTQEIVAANSGPSRATSPDIDKAYYRRVGDSIEISYVYRHTNSAGATNGDGAYTWPLPNGLTVDTTKVAAATDGSQSSDVGSGRFWNGSNADGFSAKIFAYNATALAVAVTGANSQASAWDVLASTGGTHSAANWGVSFHATVPVAEWQSDVVLSESRTEFVYNSDDSGATDTSSFAMGEQGGLVPDFPGTNNAAQALKKRCRTSRPFKHHRLEYNPGGDTFWTTEKFSPETWKVEDGGSHRFNGAYIDPISPTEFDVVFQGWAHVNTGVTVGWNTEHSAGTTWRVVCSDNPQFVETAPAQFLETTSDIFDVPAVQVYYQLTNNSITIPPGEWRIQATFHFFDKVGGPGNAQIHAMQGHIALANGDNANTPIPLLPVQAGINDGGWDVYPADSEYYRDIKFDKTVRAKITTPTTVYAVPLASVTHPDRAQARASIWAERLS